MGRLHHGSRQASQAVFESSNQVLSEYDLNSFQNVFGLPFERISSDVGGHISTGMPILIYSPAPSDIPSNTLEHPRTSTHSLF